jgi:hypothetical protein
MALPAGHVGLIVGSGSRKRCRPAMSGWMKDHSEVSPTAD